IALQLPIAAVTAGGVAEPKHGKRSIIGAWASVSRGKTVVRRAGATPSSKGWVQVARRGLPCVAEWLLPADLVAWHSGAQPKDDAKTMPALLKDPELAALFKLLYKIPSPGAGRKDLVGLWSFDIGIAPLDVE